MATAFFFGQDVDLRFKLSMGSNRPLGAANLATFDVFLIQTS